MTWKENWGVVFEDEYELEAEMQSVFWHYHKRLICTTCGHDRYQHHYHNYNSGYYSGRRECCSRCDANTCTKGCQRFTVDDEYYEELADQLVIQELTFTLATRGD